jgi:hypothetical protein
MKTAGYSGTPLPKKLGIKDGTRVALLGAPVGFELGDLPPGARVARGARAGADLTLWFVRSRAELLKGVRAMKPRSQGSGLWIVWAKKASPLFAGVTENDVRDAALAAGMVDFKVCAVDPDWSGLRFNLRS